MKPNKTKEKNKLKLDELKFAEFKIVELLDLIVSENLVAPCSFSYAVPIGLYKKSVDYITKNLKVKNLGDTNIHVILFNSFCSVTIKFKKKIVKKTPTKGIESENRNIKQKRKK